MVERGSSSASDAATGPGDAVGVADVGGGGRPKTKVVKPLTKKKLVKHLAAAENCGVLYISRVPPFLTKLYTIMNEACPDDHATWCADGRAFRISDPQRFADHCLPRFFKHNKLGTFTQQLYTYGFVRRGHDSPFATSIIFSHEHFRAGQPSGLYRIRRCASATGRATGVSELPVAAITPPPASRMPPEPHHARTCIGP